MTASHVGDGRSRRRFVGLCLFALILFVGLTFTKALLQPAVPEGTWQLAEMQDPRSRLATRILIQRHPENEGHFLAFYCNQADGRISVRVGLGESSTNPDREPTLSVDGTTDAGRWVLSDNMLVLEDPTHASRLLAHTVAGRRVTILPPRNLSGTETVVYNLSGLSSVAGYIREYCEF